MKKKIIFAVPIAVFLCYLLYSCTDEWYTDTMPEEMLEEMPKEVKEGLVKQAKEKYYGRTPEDGIIELRSSSNGNGNNGNGNNGNGNNGNGNNGNGNGNNGNGNGNGNGNNGNGNNGNNGNGNGNLALKPMWNHSSIEQNNRYQAVEFLLQMEYTFNFALPESFDQFRESDKREYILSKTSLIYLFEKKTGDEQMFLMTIIPDLSYQESTKFDPFKKMSYLKRDNKFSGLIFYHNLDGAFVNGWRYENGKVVSSVTEQTDKPDFDVVKTRNGESGGGSNCVTYQLTIVTEYCYVWGVGNSSGEIFTIGFTCGYYSVSTIDILICDAPEGDGDFCTWCDQVGGGGGSGGGQSSGNIILNNMTQNISLSNSAKNKLIQTIRDMNQLCGYRHLFSTLGSKKKFTNVVINSSQSDPASYNANTGVLSFKSESTMAQSFPEEFLHLYQDWLYPGGIMQYANPANNYTGKSNIEFEAKFLVDLLTRLNGQGGGLYGAPSSSPLYDQYNQWLEDLNDFNDLGLLTYNKIITHQFEGKGYSDFLENFKTSQPLYNYPSLNISTFPPLVVQSFNFIMDCAP